MNVPEHIQKIQPYAPGPSQGLNRDGYLCLDFNEPSWRPSRKVYEALYAALDGNVALNVYPDVNAAQLRTALGVYTGAAPSRIRVYNGSDEALRDIFAAFLAPGDGVYTPEPTYSQINIYVLAAGAQFVAAEEQAKVVYIANPNNPTGGLTEKTWIVSHAQENPDRLYVIDEAYVEYEAASASLLGVTSVFNNIVVTRSMTKAFALTGLRVGYVVAAGDVCDTLDRIRNGKSVNTLAQVAAVAALSDVGYVRSKVKAVRTAKARTVNSLEKMGYTVSAGGGPFFLVHVERPEAFQTYLRVEEKILVRRLASMPGCVRVTVSASMPDMEKFVRAARRAYASEVPYTLRDRR